MGALHDNIKIVRVDVLVVLLAIVANILAKDVFQSRSYSVLACVHVCDLCLLQPLGEGLPCFHFHVVCLPNVQTPDAAVGMLQDPQQM